MVDLRMTQGGGGIRSSIQGPGTNITGFMESLGKGKSFNPGMLQDLLRWKMGMAEKMQRAQLQGQAGDLNRQRQADLDARNQMMWQRRMAEDAAHQGGRQYPGMGPEELGTAAASTLDPGNRLGRTATDFAKLGKYMQFLGPDNVGAGTRQAGAGFAQMGSAAAGAAAGESASKFDSMARAMAANPNLASTFLPMMGGGPGSGRETGGGIPEDGWYYLHKDEEVVPSKKTVKDILMGNFKPDPKAPPSRSYQTGTRRGQMSAVDMLVGALSQDRGGFENPAAAQTYGELPPMEFEDEMGLPAPPEALQSEEGAFRETMADPEAWRWQNVGNPDVSPPEALEAMHGAQARLKPPVTRGGESSEPWIETRGKGGERSFSMTGTPETADEKSSRAHDAEMAELERMGEAAASHSRMAEQLLMHASKRPNSPAYEKLREMAGDRLKMAQEMERVRNVRQASLDARAQAMGQQEAIKVAGQLQAQGRMGAAGVAAQGRVGAAQAEGQSRLMATIGELAKAYGGIEDADPETQQQLLGQLIQQFMVMGGMAEVLGGGGGFPNSGE